jgi:hypothetical protein
MTNTCIISEQILQFYIANKTQLEFFHILNKDYEEDEIIKMIKWESNESVSDYEEFINGIENMISNNIHRQENVDGVRRNLVYSFGDGLSRFIGTTFRS